VLREEYKAIVDADLVLQLDDPGLADTWDMANPEPSVGDCKKFAMVRVEALNHALRGLPEDRIRYHICWGSWHGPHTTDLPLRNIVDVLLKVRVGAYSNRGRRIPKKRLTNPVVPTPERKFADSLRWRGLDSNFQYAGAVNLVVAPFMPPKAVAPGSFARRQNQYYKQ
jgi:hypothetical protein